MSEHAHDATDHEDHAHHGNYVKIWAILLVLLVISILGPELNNLTITLITAFGIAVVKAYLVVKHFMHLNVAPRFVGYLVATGLVFMLLFFAGVAPDVMRVEGTRWEKPDWIEANRLHQAGHRDEAHQ
jgi:caa(3)-type oxidase subunit IV